MARYDPRPHDDPKYVERWAGKRVQWRERNRTLTGLVIDASICHDLDERYVGLRVARDDGFLSTGVPADGCEVL